MGGSLRDESRCSLDVAWLVHRDVYSLDAAEEQKCWREADDSFERDRDHEPIRRRKYYYLAADIL